MRCAGGRGGQPRGPGAWRRSETDAGTMPSSCTKELSCFWVAGPPASPRPSPTLSLNPQNQSLHQTPQLRGTETVPLAGPLSGVACLNPFFAPSHGSLEGPVPQLLLLLSANITAIRLP